MIPTETLDFTEAEPQAQCAGKRVVICDNHPMIRLGLREVCDRLRCDVVAEVTTGEEALEALERLRPDLLLLDLLLPGQLDGRAVHHEVRRHNLVPKVLVITAHGDSPGFFAWIHQEDSPDAVLDKAGSPHEVKLAMVHVLTSDTKYISPLILDREQGSIHNPLTRLSRRELQVLGQVAAGDKLTDIAQRFGLSPLTIRSYMVAIYCKLGLRPHTLQAAAGLYNKWIHTTPLPPDSGSL
jgi:DNA-binding NarL/FixJ family response regulator